MGEAQEQVTIRLPREDARNLVIKAKSDGTLHGAHCERRIWYGGECNCWVSQTRKALEGSK